jgi:hypothetical protein
MQEYRIHCFGGTGRLWTADGVTAPDDDAAIESARTIPGVIKAEVWQGWRLVASVQSGASAA